jgi:phage terminase small subunit
MPEAEESTMGNHGLESLTERERAFVLAYTGEARLNAMEAARIAGYANPSANAWAIRRREDVAKAIEERLRSRHLTADEVLDEIAEVARQDLSRFITVNSRGQVALDFKKAKESGALRNVAGYEYNKQGRLVLKFHDKMTALQALGRHHKLFTDRVETSNPEGLSLLREMLGVEAKPTEEE